MRVFLYEGPEKARKVNIMKRKGPEKARKENAYDKERPGKTWELI